jgi:uncharacterized protein YoxC
MTDNEIIGRLMETEQRSKLNAQRIDELTKENETLHQLATSVAVMAEQLKTMNSSVSSLTDKVDTLESQPGKRWQSMVEKIAYLVAATIIGFALAQIGLS